MVFLRSLKPSNESAPIIDAGAYFLRPAQVSDFDQWSSLRNESRDHLVPWEPTWPRDDLTRLAFRHRVKRAQQDIKSDSNYPLLIFRTEDEVLQGGITIGNIKRGVTQLCSLGYWAGAKHASKGMMTRAVAAATAYAFNELRLNRVEAACLPANAASIRVLEKNGFQKEGFLRRYLCINGQWQDHLLYAILHSDPRLIPDAGGKRSGVSG